MHPSGNHLSVILRYWPLLIPLLILVIALLFLFVRKSDHGDQMIIGMADATFINISSAIPGKMDSLLVKEGDTVARDQLLALLSSTEVSSLQDQAGLALKAATLQLDLLRKGTRPELIGMASNLYEVARQQYEVAQTTNERIEQLYKNQVVSGEERDLVRLKYLASKHEMESARLNLEMLQKGNQPDLIHMAEVGVEQAQQALQLTRSITGDTRITAPDAGIISSVVIHSGEFVSMGYPIITLMKAGSQFIRFNIRQDLMHQIFVGKEFFITMPGCHPERFPARVRHIAPSLVFADWVPVRETGSFELRTFTVELAPLDPEAISGLRPGMTAAITLTNE